MINVEVVITCDKCGKAHKAGAFMEWRADPTAVMAIKSLAESGWIFQRDGTYRLNHVHCPDCKDQSIGQQIQ